MDHRADYQSELSGFRGVAAISVFLSHVSNATGLWDNALGRGGGQLGVMMFFALSGYLLGTLYLTRPFGLGPVLAYARNRAARVLPLFVAVLLFALFVAATSGVLLYGLDVPTLIRQFALWRGDNVFWTIPVEIHFYVLFPVLWAIFAKSRRAFWVLGAVLLLIMAGAPLSGPTFERFLPYSGHFFLAGVLLSRAPKLSAPVLWSVVGIIAAIGAVLLLPNLPASLGMQGRHDLDPLAVWRDPLYLVVVVALLAASVTNSVARRFFSLRPLRFLGDISYSVYLLHVAIIETLSLLLVPSWSPLFFTALAAVATLVVSAVSYVALEKPARRVIRSPEGLLAYWRSKQPDPA